MCQVANYKCFEAHIVSMHETLRKRVIILGAWLVARRVARPVTYECHQISDSETINNYLEQENISHMLRGGSLNTFKNIYVWMSVQRK